MEYAPGVGNADYDQYNQPNEYEGYQTCSNDQTEHTDLPDLSGSTTPRTQKEKKPRKEHSCSCCVFQGRCVLIFAAVIVLICVINLGLVLYALSEINANKIKVVKNEDTFTGEVAALKSENDLNNPEFNENVNVMINTVVDRKTEGIKARIDAINETVQIHSNTMKRMEDVNSNISERVDSNAGDIRELNKTNISSDYQFSKHLVVVSNEFRALNESRILGDQHMNDTFNAFSQNITADIELLNKVLIKTNAYLKFNNSKLQDEIQNVAGKIERSNETMWVKFDNISSEFANSSKHFRDLLDILQKAYFDTEELTDSEYNALRANASNTNNWDIVGRLQWLNTNFGNIVGHKVGMLAEKITSEWTRKLELVKNKAEANIESINGIEEDIRILQADIVIG